MATTLKIEFWTANSPSDAGTAHPLYFSVIFNAGTNLVQTKMGNTGRGEHAEFTFDISEGTAVVSAAVMLNGLAMHAPDNWLPRQVKITFGDDVLVDKAWDQWFDENHRSHELYREAFDSGRGRDGNYGQRE